MSVTARTRTVEDILSEWFNTKTRRKLIADDNNRPSCSGCEHTVGEEPNTLRISFEVWDKQTLSQAKGEGIAGAPVPERIRMIARRYGEIHEEAGVIGPKYCKHTFIDPQLRDENGKYTGARIRIKYINPETPQKLEHTLGEIWKNILFGKFLNSWKELGWSLNRDWTCERVGEPFYIVMIQGEESVKQRLQREQTRASLDDLITFVDEFSFNKEHMRKDTDALREYLILIMMSLKRYSTLAPEWSEKFEKIEDHVMGNLLNLISQDGKEFYVNWVETDGKTENKIYIRNGKKPILALVDQGQKKELLDDWLQKLHLDRDLKSNPFTEREYFRCFWGAPHVYIGQMNFSIQIGEHIPESVKDEFAVYLEKFAETGYWNGEGKKGWDQNTAKLAKNLINLGELSHVIPTYYTNRSHEWKSLADTLMNMILTDGLYTRCYPVITPIKNIQQTQT